MICNKSDLKRYLRQDAVALRRGHKKRPKLFGDEIWKFQILLRKLEYYTNLRGTKRILTTLPRIFCHIRFKRASLKLSFTIPVNAFGPGLSIAHYGCIVVSNDARIGENCRLQEGVNIGATNGSAAAPKIGNNVFIGTGAKLIGDITIADDVAIGANAVVVKSILEPGVTYGGVPAKKISNNSSRSNLAPELFA